MIFQTGLKVGDMSAVMGMWPHRKSALVIVSHIVKNHVPLQENFVDFFQHIPITLQENRSNYVCTLNSSTELLQYTLQCESIVAIRINI